MEAFADVDAGLADVDAGRMIDHQRVQARAGSLDGPVALSLRH
ncbi:hypothetical protein [Tistrella mobilis]|nr:hypothetical protein [Tistrella mobilis]